MHSVANLATLQTPLATFFPSKKRPNLVSENHRYCRARSCSPSARTHLSLSLFLSLCICSVSLQRSAERSSTLIQLNTDLCCFSNFTCKYSRNHSTAIIFILCVFGAVIMIFCADEHLRRESWLCSLNGSRFSHYFIFIPLSDNRNSKIYQWKQFCWEFSLIKIQYVGKDRETNVIINNKCTFCIFRRRAALCAKM